MKKEKVGEIRIGKRVVKIGYETYPLANISRVHTVRFIWSGRKTTSYPLIELVVLGAILGGMAWAAQNVLPDLDFGADFDIEEIAAQLVNGATILAAIRGAYLVLLFLYRVLFRRTRYALVIETSGTQFTALSGTDRDEIHRIKNEIVDAIEDPPDQERVIHISGDLVVGDKVGRDKVTQGGNNNQMTMSS